VELDGAKTIISSVRDTSERKEAEEEYRNIFEGAPVGIIRTSSGGKILTANPALARMLGYESAEELVSTISDATHQLWLHADERARFIAIMEEHGSGREFECRLKRKDGTALWVSIEGRKVCGGDGRTLYYDGFVDDVTEHKRVQAEKAKLEEQLRQAQKLESVGRLAGGVAHDFNNLLTVINGYSNTVLKLLQDNDPLKPYVEEIGNAGERAAGLTRQLLTFSRKQVIEPKVMDLNDIIRESTPMLQRLIGEDIALTTDLEPCPGRVMADPDQIHQVIMNLAVNARDAMPDGGRLEIETRNVALDAENNVAAPAGRYVLVAVTDNGHGMDDATRERVFEPFFTTKETGKGTGLGLATVYGIIRQGGGWIDVSSRPGVGTSFKMYLPRVDARAQSAKRGPSAATEKGTGTILVVEDQQAVRKYTRSVLKRYGYDVIEACDGDEATTKAAQYDGEIRLLVTDVIMPGMNGKQLSERLRKVRPNLKVLFISGYTADIIAERGVLDRSVAFLHKPFGPEDLAAKVREVLAQTS
jgi:PAS domain S-box-containing protein